MLITCPRCRQPIDTPGERIIGICPCGVGLFHFFLDGHMGVTHVVDAPDGFELVGPGEEVIAGDIHFDIGPTGDGAWDFEYPVHEEFMTSDHYPLIARPVRPDRGGRGGDPSAAPRGPAVQMDLFQTDG